MRYELKCFNFLKLKYTPFVYSYKLFRTLLGLSAEHGYLFSAGFPLTRSSFFHLRSELTFAFAASGAVRPGDPPSFIFRPPDSRLFLPVGRLAIPVLERERKRLL